MEEGIADN
jgi:Leucine-rich repeat (LRR) protein